MFRLRPILVTAVVGGGSLAAAITFFYYQEGHREGLVELASHGVHLILFAALAWSAYFVGRALSRHVFRRSRTYWEVEVALGFVVFGAAAFVLAATHLLYAWVVRGAVLLVIALSAPLWRRCVRDALAFWRRKWSGASAGAVAVVAVSIPFAFAILVRAGLPPVEWDVLVYHLYLPKVFTEAHGFVYLPRLVYASMPLGAEMMFTWAYLWNGPGAAAAVAPLLNIILVVATWRLARRYVDELWAATAAALLLFTPTFAAAAGSSNVDFIVGTFAVSALVVYLNGFRRYADAALAGVLLGAALAVKYTGIYAVIALLPILLTDVIKRKLPLRYAAAFFVIAFAVVLPWLVKAFVERGNPVFPVLYGVFGGRDLSPEAAAGILPALRRIGMGRGATDYLLLPYRVSVLCGSGYGRFAGSMWPFSFLVVPFALVWFRRWRLLTFTVFYFAAWAFMSQQLRFLSASYATLAALSAGVFAAAADAFKGQTRAVSRFALVVLILALGYVLNAPTILAGLGSLRYYEKGGAEAYRREHATCYKADEFVNDELPKDAVVLMMFDNRLFYLERPAVYDSFPDASATVYDVQKLKRPAAVAAYVDGLGVTHIMTYRVGAAFFWNYYERPTRHLWEDYLERYGTAVYDDGYYEIRALERRG
jgi:hypothetical protein